MQLPTTADAICNMYTRTALNTVAGLGVVLRAFFLYEQVNFGRGSLFLKVLEQFEPRLFLRCS